MMIRRSIRGPLGGEKGLSVFACRNANLAFEALEPRTLLSGVESASAQLHLLSTTGTAAAPVYNYGITLTDTGSTPIGTFWCGWVPGEDFFPSVPLSQSSPVGWGASVTGGGNALDGSAILWTTQPTATALAPGQSLSGFNFSSPDSPKALAGPSPSHSPTPVLTSFIYSAGPFSDIGFQFVVAGVKPATPQASTLHLTSAAVVTTIGSSVALTAKVTPATPGGATPTGNVTFKDGNKTLGAVALKSDGTAVLTTSFLTLGGHGITATYGGSTAYLGSAATLTETVNAPPAFNAIVTADLAKTNADLLKFKTDFLTGSNTLVADAVVVKTDDAKQAAAIAPLITKLDADAKAMQAALQADHLTDNAIIVADETAIRAQEVKVIQDKNSTALEAGDKAKLKTERVKLQTDLLAALNARILIRQTDETTLGADAKNLVTTIGAGSHASAVLQAAVTQFFNDKTTTTNTLLADLAKLGTDRTKLTADLTSEQSS